MFDEIEDPMIKSWLGIKDFDTHFYKSTPDLGSPYDLSVHHTGVKLLFTDEEFQSYLGAGLIKDVSEDMAFEKIEFKGLECQLIGGYEVFDGCGGTLIYKINDGKQHSLYSDNLRHNEYYTLEMTPNRANEQTRRYNSKTMNDVKLQFKEKEAIGLIINSLLKSEKPVVSSSFGKDSLVTLHLTLRACDLLNINRRELTVFYSDTLNEFPDVRLLSRKLESEWGFKLLVATPTKPLKKIIKDHGGIDESYFRRKGDRSIEGTPLSEKCCNGLKHEPFKRLRTEYKFDLTIAGTRATESRQRYQAGIRDGEYYYAKTWNSYRLNPILHWTDEEVFKYLDKYSIPLPEIYHQNIVLSKKIGMFELEEMKRLGLQDDYTISKPLGALKIKEMGFDVFMPRVGCMMCPIPINHGYLTWLRRFYPKVFKTMIVNMGYGPFVWNLVDSSKKQEIQMMLGEKISMFKLLDNKKLLNDVLDYMPCAFDID